MEVFVNNLNEKLATELRQITESEPIFLLAARRSFRAACKALDLLYNYVFEKDFRSEQEEILFFKVLKPKIQQQIVYWKEIAKLEMEKGIKSKGEIKKYILKQQTYYHQFFNRHRFHFEYYSLARTDLDNRLFVRNEHQCLPISIGSIDFCNEKATEASHILSYLLAYSEVLQYLEGSSIPVKTSKKTNTKLQWTGSKAQFIELVYAIQVSGAVNGGNVDIKHIFSNLSSLFGLEVTNYYSYFNAMSLRKKDRIVFLRHMMDQLILRMDEGIC